MSEKTNAELLGYTREWLRGRSSQLGDVLNQVLEFTLDIAQKNGFNLSWKYSDREKQWTADPNFVAFRFPSTKGHFKCWIYTEGMIDEVHGLQFVGSRLPYQCVTVSSLTESQSAEFVNYIEQAFYLRKDTLVR